VKDENAVHGSDIFYKDAGTCKQKPGGRAENCEMLWLTTWSRGEAHWPKAYLSSSTERVDIASYSGSHMKNIARHDSMQVVDLFCSRNLVLDA